MDEIRAEAVKLQKKQEQYSFSDLSKNKAYTLSTIGLSDLEDFDIPKPAIKNGPSKEPSAWIKEAIALVRQYWHVSSSENTTRTLIDVILLEVLKQLPADKKLNVWGEVNVPKRDDLNVHGAIDYVLGPPSKEDTPTKGRYVVIVEAKNDLHDHDRVQAFAEMKAALKKNNDGLTVYGVLTDAKEWCLLSLGPDHVPRLSAALQLGRDPEFAEAQLKRLLNVLHDVFVMALSQVNK